MKALFKFFAVLIITMGFMCSPALAATDVYTVQPKDSLWAIAQKYQVGLSEIIKANPQFKDPNMIYPGDKVTVPLVDEGVKSFEEQVLALCNKERAKAGAKPLTMNWQVQRVARIKSEDMRDNNYFSHTSPTYGTPFEMLKKFNISYKTAGENIAKGQKTPEAVVDSWMNSEGHRKNILNASFKELGVGYATGKGTTFWTQIFIG